MRCFSLSAFKISVPFQNLTVSGGWLSYLELRSLGCLWGLIHLPRDLLSHYFFRYSCPFSSLSSPSETPTMHMLLFIVFHRSLRFYFNIKLFFSYFHWPMFKGSSRVCPNAALNTSSEFLILATVLFNTTP